MAPRETRIDTSGPAMLSGEAAQRLLQQVNSAGAQPPPARRGPATQKEPLPVTPPPASMAAVSPAAQAATMKAAAQSGAPFCEVCKK